MIGMSEIDAFVWIKNQGSFWTMPERKAMVKDPKQFGIRMCARANHGWAFMNLPTCTEKNYQQCKQNFVKGMQKYVKEFMNG